MPEIIEKEKMLIEEVKVIQDVIKRMASNSFNVKTWTVTLIVATLLFKGKSSHIFIAFIPLFAFWFLDSYYLQQERLFRKIHNWIVNYRLENNDKLFYLNTQDEQFIEDKQSIFRIMFSVSTLPFYGSIFVMLLGYILISYYQYFSHFADCFVSCIKS